MFFLSLAITILIGYFLPTWMYDTEWATLIKIAKQDGELENLKELQAILSITQDGAQRYIWTIIGLCILIFIISMSITNIIKKALNKKTRRT